MAESTVANSNPETRYAVVTGANKGIGFGICEQLAAKGIVVVLTARDEKRGFEALEKLKKANGYSDEKVLFHKLDVADSSSVASLAQFIHSQFGKLDILVNNAGIGGIHVDVVEQKASELVSVSGECKFSFPLLRKIKPEEVLKQWEYSTQDYKSAIEGIQINYYGAKRMIDAFIPLLQKSKSPRIVNVSSTWGQLKYVPDGKIKEILADNTNNLATEKIDEIIDEFLKDVKEDSLKAKGWTAFLPAYTISKASVNAYTRIVAKKYPNIKVNAVCPGYVKTDINYNTGFLTVEEGAASPVRLALLPDDGPSGLFFSRGEVTDF